MATTQSTVCKYEFLILAYLTKRYNFYRKRILKEYGPIFWSFELWLCVTIKLSDVFSVHSNDVYMLTVRRLGSSACSGIATDTRMCRM
jgi:hypothetical protein